MSNRKKKSRFIKQLITLFVIIIAITLGLCFYISWYESAVAESQVCGHYSLTSGNKSPTFCYEIADTEGERAKGLMYRKANELGEDQGMIFVYNQEAQHSFWMKNTFLALDMIFLDSDFKVVGLVEDAQPFTEEPRKVEHPSQYIVEMHSGSAKKWNIAEGAKLILARKLPEAR